MADGQFNDLPVPYVIVSNPRDKVNTSTTINGLDLTQSRILKSVQFSEAMTGEKMLAGLKYNTVSSGIIELANSFFWAPRSTKGIVKGDVASNANLNSYKGSDAGGVYFVGDTTNMTNAPASYGFLLVMANDTYTIQVFFHVGAAIYMRSTSSGGVAWSTWKSVVLT